MCNNTKKDLPVVLQINVSANYGSTGRIAEMIGRYAKEDGYECYMAYGRDFRPGELNYYRIGGGASIKCHFLLSRLFDRQGFGSYWATRQLIQYIKKIGPTVIHLHNIHGYYLNYRLLFRYLKDVNIPIVWTMHDCWPFTGHCSHFAFIGCDKWKTGCVNCPGLGVYPPSVLLDNSSQNYQLKKELFSAVKDRLTIIPVSNWLEGLVKESFLKDATIKTIHNGIDTDTFRDMGMKYPNLPKDKKIVLAVTGVWDEKKGFNDVLELSGILSDEYRIVMVGLTLRQLSMLPKNIIGIQRTDNLAQLASLYATADVYINPTWEDNFPTTNIEALACGTPVITYRTGGSVEAITPETGAIVEQGDITALKSEIERICSLDRNILKTKCREHAVAYFEMRDRYREYIDIYDTILKRKIKADETN